MLKTTSVTGSPALSTAPVAVKAALSSSGALARGGAVNAADSVTSSDSPSAGAGKIIGSPAFTRPSSSAPVERQRRVSPSGRFVGATAAIAGGPASAARPLVSTPVGSPPPAFAWSG